MKFKSIPTARAKTLKAELTRLANLLSKYSHRWGGESNSDRMGGWVGVFEAIRLERRDAYKEWLADDRQDWTDEARRQCAGDDCTAYDCMA